MFDGDSHRPFNLTEPDFPESNRFRYDIPWEFIGPTSIEKFPKL